ncbi:hypothetical protein JZO81_14965 [Enterococcus hulanensis]|nr:hypothetical protein [Enterococcus hulanensis]
MRDMYKTESLYIEIFIYRNKKRFMELNYTQIGEEENYSDYEYKNELSVEATLDNRFSPKLYFALDLPKKNA